MSSIFSQPPERNSDMIQQTSRNQPETVEDLLEKMGCPKDWVPTIADLIRSERADAAWIQMESREKAEKKALKKAKKEWEAKAKKMMEEEIATQVGAVNKRWQDHYEKEKKSCEDEVR